MKNLLKKCLKTKLTDKSQIKKYLYISLYILVLCTPIFSETITLHVGKDEYVKELPNDTESLKKLVRDISAMYNTLNETHQKSINDALATYDSINTDLATIKTQTINTEEKINTITNQLTLDKTDIINSIKNISTTKTFGFGGGIMVNPTTFKTFQYNIQGILNIGSKLFVSANAGINTSLSDQTVEPMVGFTIGTWVY